MPQTTPHRFIVSSIWLRSSQIAAALAITIAGFGIAGPALQFSGAMAQTSSQEAQPAKPDAGTGSQPATAGPAGATPKPADNKSTETTPAKSPVATSQAQNQNDWRRTSLPPDLAYAAFQRGRFVTAFREAMKRIEAGSPNAPAAMTLIAELYRDGLGFRQDPAEAIKWYTLAEKRGDREAAFALGRAYLKGFGVPKNKKKAIEFFEKAAQKGNATALYNLGVIAMEPISRDKDGNFEKAAEFYAKASREGSLDANYALALLYRSGRGVKRDDQKATSLLKSAADQHHLVAMTEYAIALFNGRGTKKDETAAARYMTRAAWRNSPVAQNRIARMLAAGRGVKKDMVEAMKWHIIARATGVKDKWLDGKLPFLTRTQRKLVDEQVRRFVRK